MEFLPGCFALFPFSEENGLNTQEWCTHANTVLHAGSGLRGLELWSRIPTQGSGLSLLLETLTQMLLTRGSCSRHLVSWSFPPAVTSLAPSGGAVCAVRGLRSFPPASPSCPQREVLSDGRAAGCGAPSGEPALTFWILSL